MTDFAEVLRTALRVAGCDDTAYRFDAHSPITMAFSDVGDVTLVPEGDEIWLWYELANTSTWQLSHNAGGVLDILSAPRAFLKAGCLSLRTDGDSLWLGGELTLAVRQEGEQLADALSEFHTAALNTRAFLS